MSQRYAIVFFISSVPGTANSMSHSRGWFSPLSQIVESFSLDLDAAGQQEYVDKFTATVNDASSGGDIYCAFRFPHGGVYGMKLDMGSAGRPGVKLFSDEAMDAFRCALEGNFTRLGSVFDASMQEDIKSKLESNVQQAEQN